MVLGPVFFFDVEELIDFRLDSVLAFGERVELGLGDDEGFVGVVSGDEFGDGGDTEALIFWCGGFGIVFEDPFLDGEEEVGVAVHLFVFDEGAAEDELRDEDQWDAVGSHATGRGDTGDEQSEGDAAESGDEHDPPVGEEHSADLQDGVANEHEDGALNGREKTERKSFGEDVGNGENVEVTFAIEDDAVADDVVYAVHQGEEHGDEERDEDVGGDVKCAGEVVATGFVVGVVECPADDAGEERWDDEGEGEGSDAAHFGAQIALEHGSEAEPFFAETDAATEVDGDGCCGGKSGQVLEVDLLNLLNEAEALKSIAPVSWGEAACGDELSLGVFLVDDVSAEVAERGFEHVENELGSCGAAGGASADFLGEVLFVFGLCEIREHFRWSAEEDHLTALIEEDGLREHVKELRGGLVKGNEDDFVVGGGADDFEDVFGVF
ncbi:MAG: hypothetical protein RIS92_525 [Verrucomicrobiota bacterium]